MVNFIREKFETEKNRSELSTRKLAKAFLDETGIHTNRQTVSEIIRNKLGYTFRKSKIKNNKINSKENTLITCSFLKIISRCIYLGFKIIYCDESGFTNKNNNYYSWKKKGEEIYFDYENIEKFSLNMAVDENNVLNYKINKVSTNSDIFLDFIKELQKKLNDKHYPEYVIVLDNLAAHKTNALIEYYAKNKINIIFNSPYLSSFNSIELAFRGIKKKYMVHYLIIQILLKVEFPK